MITTKQQIEREEIARLTKEFLKKGGKIGAGTTGAIKMKNQPEEIFLNLGDDVDCDDYNELVEGAIGWSTEPCTTDVLRYVRADMKDKEELTKAFVTWFEREVKELGAFKDEEAGKKLLLTAWLNGAFCGGVL